VKAAYNQLVEGDANTDNPMEKKALVISGNEATLIINQLDNERRPEQANNPNPGVANIDGGHLDMHSGRQMMGTILHQLNCLQTEINNLRTDITAYREADRQAVMAQFRIVHTNIRRIANQPNRRMQQAAEQQQQQQEVVRLAPPLPAELSPMPKNLYDLWQEYQIGIAGRKPARNFTAQERGRCKFKYCRRNFVWKLIVKLVNAGITAQAACDRIYNIYGEGASVTTIINKLKKDIQTNNLHHTLRV
jgi:Transcriptional activator of glycolytic enzymes